MVLKLMVCKVIAVDIIQKMVTLEHIYKQTGISKEAVRFGAPYAPAMNWQPNVEKDPFSSLVPKHPLDEEPMASSPAGMFAYPKAGEMVLIAARIDEASGQTLAAPIDALYEVQEVIIICRVFDNAIEGGNIPTPRIGLHDQLWLDRSGAKIHFNHLWDDADIRNVIKNVELGVKEGERVYGNVGAAQGHLTVVGNRTVDLVGSKWAGFGLYSHLFEPGKEKTTPIINAASYPPDQEGNDLTRDALFSKDGSVAYDPNYAYPKAFKQGTDYWLEPPCPETGAYMRLHQSGHKIHVSNVVGLEGQELRVVRNRVTYLGSGVLPLSLDPDDEDSSHSLVESTTEGSTVASRDGHDFTQYVDSSGKVATSLLATGGLKTEQMGGVALEVPTALPTTFGTDPTYMAEAGKVKIKVGNAVVIIDSSDDSVTITASGGVTITGDIGMTGDLTVTGNIEATLDVKGATGTF